MAGRAADWSVIKARWEKGDPIERIAVECRRKRVDIESTAARERWDNSKRPKPSARTREALPTKARIVLTEPTKARIEALDLDPSEALDQAAAEAQHMSDFQAVRLVAMRYLGQIDSFQDHIVPKVLTSIAGALKTVQDGQRKCLGLDKRSDNEAPTDAGGIVYLPHKAPLPDDGITPIIPGDAANPDGD